MEKVFSPSAQQVFFVGYHSDIPADARPISAEDERDYVGMCPPGKRIEVGQNGGWRHVDVPSVPKTLEEQRQVVDVSRCLAYADPLTGSDRFFAEAQRETVLGNAEAAEAARSAGLARYAEIQAEHPWPAE